MTIRVGDAVSDLVLPQLLIHEAALQHNVDAMASWCADHGVLLAPHGKTTMSPQLIRRQLRAGAWGITAANPLQARRFAEMGATRVLIANEVADRAGLAWMASVLGELELFCYADSVAGVRLLEDAMRRAARPLPVLVEVGFAGGRGGARSRDTVLEVARAVDAAEHLELAGVAGYEGAIHGIDDLGEMAAAVRAFCRQLVAAGVAVAEAGLLPAHPIVTAGGSSWFDIVAHELPVGWPAGVVPRVVLRSGCYVTHDHGAYAVKTPAARGSDGPQLWEAIEIRANVISRPEPGLALLDAGRRNLPFDAGLPTPVRVLRDGCARDVDTMTITALNDQHAFVDVDPGDPLAVGDVVAMAISHPCTAFDKWREFAITDDDGRVLEVGETRF